jgi:phospholipase C
MAKKVAAGPSSRGRISDRVHCRTKAYLRVEQLEDRNMLSASGLENSAIEGLKNNIDHIVVIYQENWSFDSLYGFFPGANGIANATNPDGSLIVPQVDKNGNIITTLPAVKGPDGNPDPRFPANLAAQPYNAVPFLLQNAPPGDPAGLTGDMIHRFYTEQQQIDGGAMDKFVTWSDNGGLVLSYINSTNLPEGQLAQQFTLDDNFFHAAFGGSFLNHQFLIAAAAPAWNQPLPTSTIKNGINTFVSNADPNNLRDANLTADGQFVVNTTFAADAPHPNRPADQLLQPINDSDPTKPDYMPTIGDRLNDAGVSWRWYSGGWNDALAGNPATDPNGFGGGFQFHHQPFAYYQNFAPFNADGTLNPNTTGPNAHLQDETQFFADVAAGNLPSVSFIKPIGANNEHPGYADELAGQQHVADLVSAIQNSSAWGDTAIIITYDENGGRWDHVSPPVRDQWGDGTRVPAIVISPFAKRGFVDHTQHDTLSILKTIEERFNLNPLNERDAGASDLLSSFSFPNPDAGTPADRLAAAQKDLTNDLTELSQLANQLTADRSRLDVINTQMDTLRDQLRTDRQNGDLTAIAADLKAINAEEDLLDQTQQDVKSDKKEIRKLVRDIGEDFREEERLEDNMDEN